MIEPRSMVAKSGKQAVDVLTSQQGIHLYYTLRQSATKHCCRDAGISKELYCCALVGWILVRARIIYVHNCQVSTRHPRRLLPPCYCGSCRGLRARYLGALDARYTGYTCIRTTVTPFCLLWHITGIDIDCSSGSLSRLSPRAEANMLPTNIISQQITNGRASLKVVYVATITH